MAAFVTQCEAYLRIKPHFNMWNYFFCAQLQEGSDMKMMALGSVDILVQSWPRVDPYFHLPVSNPSVGWRKMLFFLRKDANMPLPAFTGSRPVPWPNWRYGVAQTYLYKLQTL
jgi:hypothetical protein